MGDVGPSSFSPLFLCFLALFFSHSSAIRRVLSSLVSSRLSSISLLLSRLYRTDDRIITTY